MQPLRSARHPDRSEGGEVMMNDEKVITALREWANRPVTDGAQLASLNWYREAQRQVREIIDPPVPCACRQENVRGCTIQRGGVLHTRLVCGPCCTHGVSVHRSCVQCNPPKPKWRQMVEVAFDKPYETCARDPLVEVLRCLTFLQDGAPESIQLARIVAVCEAQVGDGWQADPDEWPPGHWGIAWLLVTLSSEPPNWPVLGDRAAAWLRELTDGGAA